MKQSKLWVVLCAAILLLGVAGCLWVLRPTGGDTVEILQDGKLLYTLDLSRSEDQVIEIPYTGSSNIIQVQDGKIRVLEAECPDQICVHMGYLSDTGLPIVCLPNRLVIQYQQAGTDGATG
ncbi:NusG domain II-containing protein [Pseudoflavonifractor sp. 60]|uniref:NusG domain II-containing protein n=1 Tax=Pseudoflavonifractor sp. 60 TaxID=2304576 RepID=UPI00136A13DE|nr:NusG domain II-containing protein [Pseudoflavonifractor sp. 60]MCI8913697.1 NusG domain II-containing protein [Lawsonibacter sp.]NBI66591.1 NusG domain II-containing protein [Pseudoflavonifractor sp. 60]